MQAALNKILNSRKMNKMRWMSLLTGLIQSRKASMLVQILTQLLWLVVVEIPIEPDGWLLIKYFQFIGFLKLFIKTMI